MIRKDAAKKGQRMSTWSGPKMMGFQVVSNAICQISLGLCACEDKVSVAGSLQKSTEVTRTMQSLTMIPDIQDPKNGITEEVFKDTFENVDNQEEKEEAEEMETDRILYEIAGGFWVKHTVKGPTPF